MLTRSREEQVREDLERGKFDYLARDFGLTEERLDAYGRFIASLAPMTHFITLTHDPRRLVAGQPHRPMLEPRHTSHHAPPAPRIVGRQRHRRQVARWFFDDVRTLDPTARVYGEMELQKSGQSHEHLVGQFSDTAPMLSIRDAWYRRAGYCDIRRIEGGDDTERIARAMYVAKYTGKSGAIEPFIGGFGLMREASHSQTLEGIW